MKELPTTINRSIDEEVRGQELLKSKSVLYKLQKGGDPLWVLHPKYVEPPQHYPTLPLPIGYKNHHPLDTRTVSMTRRTTTTLASNHHHRRSNKRTSVVEEEKNFLFKRRTFQAWWRKIQLNFANNGQSFFCTPSSSTGSRSRGSLTQSGLRGNLINYSD